MKKHKILILLLYYDRPVMVQNALRSVLRADQHHQDWHVAFIDDASPRSGEEIVGEFLSDRYTYHNTNTPLEEKMEHGSMVGKTMNSVIAESDADLVIMLCDDDELCPTYLAGLNEFFSDDRGEVACYSHVHVYNPLFENSEYVNNPHGQLNAHVERINPYCKLDASQVAWRRDLDIQFAWPLTKCLDADLYQKLGEMLPEGIPFSGLVGQYKGVHPAQLQYHDESKVWDGHAIDVPDGRRMMPMDGICQLIGRYVNADLRSEAIRICELALEVHSEDQLLRRIHESLHKQSKLRFVAPTDGRCIIDPGARDSHL